ncbi:hypothetical protein B0J13DRAFT_677376 [Dactylonectria estremocensis]|uniref:NmrA-like domain-containing protein n=1 Tax=Dactylonectria estremocensis TaxID=1079267 RepID=A0A9P9J0T7_9HYPO|nr:hypothetical protein B0J13DRAFT_677376 [Dactylonectria estremocensis]
MASFQNVTLLGKGLLGTAVLEQLAVNGYTVTILSRDPSNVTDVPSGVQVAQVDYSSKESLVKALKGQDAVVSTIGAAGLASQKLIIDASIEAGVKRFIPSDFGSFSTDPGARDFPLVKVMIEIQDHLKEKAAAGALEYTIFSTGAFLEYFLASTLVLDFANHSVDLFDQGVHSFSLTSVATIGKAVANALKAPDVTKNRNLKIHEAVLTQARVLGLAKKYSPPGTQWTETQVDPDQALSEATAKVMENPADIGAAYAVVKASVLGGKFRTAYDTVDNELLGIRLLSDEEIEAKIAAIF